MSLSLSGISGAPTTQSIQKTSAALQAVIASIVSGEISPTGGDVAALSTAAQLQSQTAGLRQVSSNLVQGTSVAQVADGGAAQIQDILTQLQSVAQQAASPTLNADTRQQLNDQFQQLSDQVDALANDTTFNGQPLLDGSISGDNSLSLDSLLGSGDGGGGLSVPDLSSNSLFGGQNLNVLSADGANQAASVISNAINEVTGVRANIGSFEQTVNYAAANVDSALANQEAARSTLSDTDFASASTQYSLDSVQQNASIALAAQTNNLSPALLQLVG